MIGAVYVASVKRARCAEASAAYRGALGAQLTQAEQVAEIFRAVHGDNIQEHACVFYLDAQNKVTAIETVAVGAQNCVHIKPAEVFRGAIIAGALSIILAHNHPSGDCTPSSSDRELTARITEVGKLVNIPVLDHVIVAAGSCYSFAAKQVLDTGIGSGAQFAVRS